MHSYGRVPSLHSRPTSEQLRRFSLASRQPIVFQLHRMLGGCPFYARKAVNPNQPLLSISYKLAFFLLTSRVIT